MDTGSGGLPELVTEVVHEGERMPIGHLGVRQEGQDGVETAAPGCLNLMNRLCFVFL